LTVSSHSCVFASLLFLAVDQRNKQTTANIPEPERQKRRSKMDEDNDLLNESYESMTQVDPLSLLLSVKTSNHVYVKSDEYAWVPARLLESDGEKATVSIPHYRDEQAIQSDGGRGSKTSSKVVVELKDYPTRALYLQNVDEEGNLREVEDMVDLPFLHEVCIAR
jgi:hypothetical protein